MGNDGSQRRRSRLTGAPGRMTVIAISVAVVTTVTAVLLIAPPALGVEVLNEANAPVARFTGVRSFQIAHTHSVMRTPVEDYYVVQGRDRLVQTKTRYRSLGAGLPSGDGGEFRSEEGWFVKENFDSELPYIRIRVGRVSDQVLTVGEHSVPFRELDQAGKALTIRARIVLFSVLWI